MAGKESGIGNNLYVSGVDVSGEARDWSLSSPVATLDYTNITQGANARGFGQRSSTHKTMTHMDPASASWAALSTLPRTDAVITTVHRPLVGAPAASQVMKEVSYDPNRDDKGQIILGLDAQSNNSFADWGVLATAGKRVDTTATNGPGVDHGAVPLGSFGLQAYLHVFAFTGTSCTVKLQSSTDDGVGDAYADVTGGAFTVVTAAPVGERLITSRTQAVERWLRVVTSGTFTSITFAVQVTVNDVDVEF